ncbi:uncharacterized protein EV422DRAFT_17578 [Fimicolochytrium jonesii]|uniref:uncharacterized protein n=1 Tax=Fimicolochytrium jonesii TaxID=1396493 RepID=UPI0022FF3C34|nr:uncharacterized protein EV422DRAFT_17578 [Fimicolochytrium jonesii]KAI8826925.1 hypothetical protein EV422DRAFT_17578 [Fimicolochytrium jonesii]
MIRNVSSVRAVQFQLQRGNENGGLDKENAVVGRSAPAKTPMPGKIGFRTPSRTGLTAKKTTNTVILDKENTPFAEPTATKGAHRALKTPAAKVLVASTALQGKSVNVRQAKKPLDTAAKKEIKHISLVTSKTPSQATTTRPFLQQKPINTPHTHAYRDSYKTPLNHPLKYSAFETPDGSQKSLEKSEKIREARRASVRRSSAQKSSVKNEAGKSGVSEPPAPVIAKEEEDVEVEYMPPVSKALPFVPHPDLIVDHKVLTTPVLDVPWNAIPPGPDLPEFIPPDFGAFSPPSVAFDLPNADDIPWLELPDEDDFGLRDEVFLELKPLSA